MTTPATRGDALAEAVRYVLNHGNLTATDANHLRDALVQHDLATYRASQVEGERVRLAVYRGLNLYSVEPRDTISTDALCFVEFSLPPRFTPPTVEAGTVSPEAAP